MELLFYISGLLTTLIAILVGISIKVNRKYTTLLKSNQSISNISSIRDADTREEIKDLHMLIRDIQTNMEKDQYESLSGINKELKVMGELAVSNNRKIGENAKVFNQNVVDLMNQITLCKGQIKALGQDQRGTRDYT